MKFVFCFLILGVFTFNGFCQEKQIVNTSGKQFTLGNLQLTFSVGEPIVGKIGNQSSLNISQGFLTGSNRIAISPQNSFFIYPNPTYGPINLNGDQLIVKGYILFDIAGRKIFHSTSTLPNLKGLPNGIYILKLLDDSGNNLKVFTLLKQ